MNVQLGLFDEEPEDDDQGESLVPHAVRNTDPITSHWAVPTERVANNQEQRLLWAYNDAGDRGLTNDEAGQWSGLRAHRSSSYWRRCTSLEEKGYIESNGTVRPGESGKMQQVRVITDEGVQFLRGLSR